MILNSLNNQFTIYFPKGFIYEEVQNRWINVIKRLKLPFQSIEDFLNSSIQSITFPSIDLPIVKQQQSQFDITYKGGKELEPVFDKNISITFKLSEGFISYWILFEQIELYLQYVSKKQTFWNPMYISFLNHQGFELVVFEFEKIVPTSLSQFDVSYSQTIAEFNTFTLGMKYNRFNIKRRNES